jgi:DNA-binding LytR/AlgR family response regulator
LTALRTNPSVTAVKLVLVEDDPACRLALELELAVPGRCEIVGSFPDAESALLALSTTAPAQLPQAALLDVGLPGMNGAALVAQLRMRHPNVVCVMLSTDRQPERILASLQAGAVGYLLKDTPASEILNALEEARSGGTPLSRPVARIVVQQLGALAPVDQDVSAKPESVIELKTGPGTGQFVSPRDVALIQSQDNYSEIILASGRRVMVRQTLASWEDQLPTDRFLRVHRRTIVNVGLIQAYEHQDDETTLLTLTGLAEPVRARRQNWAELRTRLAALGREL